MIKTMILVCAFYAIAWLPENIYFLLMGLKLPITFNNSGYYSVLFIAFLYICANITIIPVEHYLKVVYSTWIQLNSTNVRGSDRLYTPWSSP